MCKFKPQTSHAVFMKQHHRKASYQSGEDTHCPVLAMIHK